MKESLDKEFAKFIEKNAEALGTAAGESPANLSMLWVVLVYVFDFNALYLYDTNDSVNFQESFTFKRNLLAAEPEHESFAYLIKTAFAEDKARSTQKEGILRDNMLFVEAIAAIPLFINDTKKVLVICKQLVKPKDEVIEGYVFDSYKLEFYLSVIKIFLRVHEQERQILQNEKLAELGTLTAGIAHEINNPLNTIITKLTLLREYVLDFKQFLTDFKDDNRLILNKTKRLNADFIIDRLEKSIQLPLEMAERVKKTVLSLKRFAAIDTGELEFIDVNQLLEEALEILENKLKYKAVVTKGYAQNIKLIKTSPNRLSQIFVNILDNAADAIVNHGKIQIKTWQDDKEIFIEITDDGVGIAPQHLKKIFTPYFTSKEGGLGIGLYLSHRILRELNGTIAVESEPGKGTAFTIRLPLERD